MLDHFTKLCMTGLSHLLLFLGIFPTTLRILLINISFPELSSNKKAKSDLCKWLWFYEL